MQSIVYDLVRRFGGRNIRGIYESKERFDISQIGKDFFKGDEKVQFYVFEENMGIELIAFTKTTEQTLFKVIALDYFIKNDNSNLPTPTHLICATKERYKFNCVIYFLKEDQVYQIQEEYLGMKNPNPKHPL